MPGRRPSDPGRGRLSRDLSTSTRRKAKSTNISPPKVTPDGVPASPLSISVPSAPSRARVSARNQKVPLSPVSKPRATGRVPANSPVNGFSPGIKGQRSDALPHPTRRVAVRPAPPRHRCAGSSAPCAGNPARKHRFLRWAGRSSRDIRANIASTNPKSPLTSAGPVAMGRPPISTVGAVCSCTSTCYREAAKPLPTTCPRQGGRVTVQKHRLARAVVGHDPAAHVTDPRQDHRFWVRHGDRNLAPVLPIRRKI